MGYEPFLAQLMCVAFNFAPKGWALCNGQLLPINTNQALFSLLGTQFGGDGRVTFALPNLQGRVAANAGGGLSIGELGGEAAHTLSSAEMPQHQHVLSGIAATAATQIPTGHMLANTTGTLTIYGPQTGGSTMASASLTPTGGSQAHDNQSPYLVLNWIIALQGIFPSRN